MQGAKTSRLRDTRKPRHGWFDYEIFDVFGDELRSDGIAVYMTLARFCYGGYRVKMSLREMAGHARMSKDTFSRNLKRVIGLGLVIEHKGRTPQSASDYDLVDVKDLAAEYLRSGIEHKEDLKSVARRDSLLSPATHGPQRTLADLILAKRAANMGGSPTATQEPLEAVVEVELSQGDDKDCLPMRQIGFSLGLDEENYGSATEVSQNDPRFETEVSQALRHPLIKETRNKNKNSPLPLSQAKGGVLDSIAASVDGTDKSKNPPDEMREVGAAVAKVKRECGQSSKRLDPVIEAALRLEASKTDQRADWNGIAERMAKSYAEYLANLHLMAFKPGFAKFITGLWDDQRKWPWDEKRLREIQSARVGSRGT